MIACTDENGNGLYNKRIGESRNIMTSCIFLDRNHAYQMFIPRSNHAEFI